MNSHPRWTARQRAPRPVIEAGRRRVREREDREAWVEGVRLRLGLVTAESRAAAGWNGVPPRIVSRVADFVVSPMPGTIRSLCHMCALPVAADAVPADGLENARMVCSRCVAATPELRAVAPPRWLAAAVRGHAVIDRWHAECN